MSTSGLPQADGSPSESHHLFEQNTDIHPQHKQTDDSHLEEVDLDDQLQTIADEVDAITREIKHQSNQDRSSSKGQDRDNQVLEAASPPEQPPVVTKQAQSQETQTKNEHVEPHLETLEPSVPSVTEETASALVENVSDAQQAKPPAEESPQSRERPSSTASTLEPSSPPSTLEPSLTLSTLDNIILGIAVVDFNHLVGPQIEYAHPKELLQDQDLVKSLPFLALPDGSHLSDEDFCFFHLHCPKLSKSTIFGISCNRQIASDALLKKGAEVTRSTVQKAVVVLAREPVFGPIREKLGIVTRAFFAQGDLADVEILQDFHSTLEGGLQSGGLEEDRETVMYMGTSLRELIHKWRFKTLVLIKLLLLQRRIMFFGYPVERLCNSQYSLVSLIPALLLNLQDAGDPSLDLQASKRVKADSLRSSDRKSLMKFLGMPLNIFGENSFFQPYCPLQQIDMLKSRSWLVGTSNSIFKQQRDCKIDVIVDLEHSNLEFQDPKLQQIVGLTAEDRKWMDEIVQSVIETWNPVDPTRPSSMGYHGSDDYLRSKFEDYICAMLSTTKYEDFLVKNDPDQVSITAPDSPSSATFGLEFLEALRATDAFSIWNATTDPMLFDIVDHKHPCEGKISAFEDVGLRLTQGLHDLRLEENLAPTREAIGSALQAGGANIVRLASNFRNDLVKFRATHMNGNNGPTNFGALGLEPKDNSPDRERPSQDSVSRDSVSTGSQGTAKITGEAIDANGRRTSSTGRNPFAGSTTHPGVQQGLTAANEAMTAAGQAAAQAGSQVRAAFGSFGSFLSSKQKAWSSARANNTPTPSSPVASASTLNTDPRT